MHRPILVDKPSERPVTTPDAKTHLKVEHSDDDALIDVLIDAAISHLDGYGGVLGRCIITQTWRQEFDDWARCLRLPLLAASVVSVTYLKADGTTGTVAEANYGLQADGIGSHVRFLEDYSFPSNLAESCGVKIEFTAGYGDAAVDVPGTVRTIILMLVAHWYANREAVNVGNITTVLPLAAVALIEAVRSQTL